MDDFGQVKSILEQRMARRGEEPLYKCLADSILVGMEKGLLPPGSRLPNLREMAARMNISLGTVNHAYDELEKLGAVEKKQGRGTFVRARESTSESAKARAMAAIDTLLDEMDALGFSPTETQIFFQLKLREREEAARVSIVVADCNPEALQLISRQVEKLPGVSVQRALLAELERTPRAATQADLVVTTANHFDQVEGLVRGDKVFRVALGPSAETVAHLARIEQGKTGLLTASEKFADIIRRRSMGLDLSQASARSYRLGSGGDLAGLLRRLDNAILPEGYETFCTQEEREAIRAFARRGGVLVPFSYRIDAGSLMFLEQKAAALLAEKI